MSCGLPESDAEALVILNNYYVHSGHYSWDHTDLTAAVQAHPAATEAQLAALHGAIAAWSAALRACFAGRITLTDVTGTQPSEQRAADIVIHFVPDGLGFFAGGVANCGDHGCPNVFVRSEYPFGLYGPDYNTISPEELGWVALHELGHALGLGHATNLKSTDLMGYGWGSVYPYIPPVLSDCDVDALAFVFAWALEGSEPRPPAEGPYDCSLD